MVTKTFCWGEQHEVDVLVTICCYQGFNCSGAGEQTVGDITVCPDAKRRGDNRGSATFRLTRASSVIYLSQE